MNSFGRALVTGSLIAGIALVGTLSIWFLRHGWAKGAQRPDDAPSPASSTVKPTPGRETPATRSGQALAEERLPEGPGPTGARAGAVPAGAQQTVDQLEKALRSQEQRQRVEAALSLGGRVKEEEAVAAIERGFADQTEEVRISAGMAAAVSADARFYPSLLKALRNASDDHEFSMLLMSMNAYRKTGTTRSDMHSLKEEIPSARRIVVEEWLTVDSERQ